MMQKKVSAVVFVLLLAAVTVCICSSSDNAQQNYEGPWKGNTSYNGEVELKVSGNNLTHFSISVKEVPVDMFDKTTGLKIGTAISNTKYTCNAFNAPIVNSKFYYSPTPPDAENTITGVFTSLRETEGIWKHKHEDLWGVVRVYPLITWSATRVGVATSAGTRIAISPAQKTVNPGETFTVDIAVTPNQPITEIKLDLRVDPSLLTVNSVTNGGMFTDNFGSYSVEDTFTMFGIATRGAILTPGTFATVNLTADPKNAGTSALQILNVEVEGPEGKVISDVHEGNVTVRQPPVFDTGYGTYPSIAGTHTGTIRPKQDMKVYELYTYSCPGTGGHSESVRIWDDTEVVADRDGYTGDWRSIRFSPPFVLLAGRTYHYCIRTGSYPQIIHERSLTNEFGTINCTEFVDVNGRSYDNRIPAFRLVGEFMGGEG